MKEIFTSARLWLASALLMGAMAVSAQDYTLSPESGSTVPDLEGIIVTFADASNVTGNTSLMSFTNNDTGATLSIVEDNRWTPAGSTFVYFADYDFLEIEGTYTFHASAGAFIVDGTPFDQEIEAVYTIDANYDPGQGGEAGVNITPASGSLLSKIDEFVVVFSGSEWTIADAGMIFLTGPDNTDIPVEVHQTSGFDGSQMLVISTEEAVTAPGDYQLVIGYGAINFGGEINEEPYTFSYTIVSGHWDDNVTITPSEGPVDKLKQFYVTFEGAESIVPDQYATSRMMPAVYRYDNGTIGAKVVGAVVYVSENVLDLSLFSTVKGDGVYALVIPKDYLVIDGLTLENDLVFVYSINADVSFDWTCVFDPADGANVEEFTMMTTTFEGVSRIERQEMTMTLPRLYLLDENGAVADYFPGTFSDLTDKSFLFIPGEYFPVTEPGTYKYVVPAGYVTLWSPDGTQSIECPEISTTFVLSETGGISDVKTEETVSAVYTVGGVKVQGDPSRLAPGTIVIERRDSKVKKTIVH